MCRQVTKSHGSLGRGKPVTRQRGSQSPLNIKVMRDEGLDTIYNNTIAIPSSVILERLRKCLAEQAQERNLYEAVQIPAS